MADVEDPPQRDDRHIISAVKLVMFSIVGMGWLSVREYLGDLPVMDATVLISITVLASLNLVLALLFPTHDVFAGPAKAFFTEILALSALYGYSLATSTSDARVSCADGPYTLGGVWTASFFGGLPMHVAAGALTLAFLLIYLIVAAGQVRACTREPSEWLAGGAGQAVLIPIAVHLALLAYRAPLASPETPFAGLLMFAVAVMFLLMLRLDWLASLPGLGNPWFGPHVQFVFEAAITLTVGVLAACLEGFTRGAFPLGLFLVGVAILVGQSVGYRWALEAGAEDYSPSAPPGEGLVARMMVPMVVPRVRALAGGRTKKSR